MAMGMRKRGFTLIELLVVIAILAILAAILLPVFARVRENARKANCVSNVRQIGMATMAYAQDYDEFLPCTWDGGTLGDGATSGAGGWMHFTNFNGPATFYPAWGSLYPYVKNTGVYQCPSDTARLGNSYAINSLLSVNSGIVAFHLGLPLAALQEPASTFLFAEEGFPGSAADTTDDGYFMVSGNKLTRRHAGGCDFAYCDGHAKHLKTDAVLYPNPGGAHRFEPW